MNALANSSGIHVERAVISETEIQTILKNFVEKKQAPILPTIEPPPQKRNRIVAKPRISANVLPFKTPVELLLALRPGVVPYKWQVEELLRLAGYFNPNNLAERVEFTSANPLLYNLLAVNGSGKDEYIIAPFAIWMLLCNESSRTIITSSSYEQLKFQTDPHIRSLIAAAKKLFGSNIIRSVEFHAQSAMGSEIKLFATDEAGRAEGYHPWGSGKMAIIVNEAKTVSDEIFSALYRCSGFSHFLQISSAGMASGEFYTQYLRSVKYPNKFVSGRPYSRVITCEDCPHISLAHRQTILDTKEHSLARNMLYCEFLSSEGNSVISLALWDKCVGPPKLEFDTRYCLGADLAAGRDECALYLRKGHKIVDSLFFVEQDTTRTAEIIDSRFRHILGTDYVAVMDDGHVGHAIIDILQKRGWRIRRVNNNSRPRYSEYLNLGAYLYFHTKRLLEHGLIQVPEYDSRLRQQITSRKYEYTQGGKIKLQDKAKHRATFGESPDRADAFVLACSSLDARAAEFAEDESEFARRDASRVYREYYDGLTPHNYDRSYIISGL